MFKKQKWFIIWLTVNDRNFKYYLLLISKKPCLKTAKTYKTFWNTISKSITIIRSATWRKGYLFSKIESDKVFQFKILKNLMKTRLQASMIFQESFSKRQCLIISPLQQHSYAICQFLPVDFLTPAKKKNWSHVLETDPEHYRRPISALLPTYVKSAGVNSKWAIHGVLDKHKILHKFQSGFPKNHSTDFCLSYLAS